MQEIVTAIIVCAAVAYLASRWLMGNASKSGSCGACQSCEVSEQRSPSGHAPLLQLEKPQPR